MTMSEENELNLFGLYGKVFQRLGKCLCMLRGPTIDHDGPLVLDDIDVVKAQSDRINIAPHL
jgi:hypothetical protein